MKINVAKSAGFCFGVKRALKIAFGAASEETNVCMLGDIVHNEDVVSEIEKSGIRKIKKLSSGKNKTLLICAHGTSHKTFKKAVKLGYKIIDATCPMVHEIHRTAIEMEKKGYGIIIIGDNNHDEVKGIVGQLKREAIVIENAKNIPLNKIRKMKKLAVVVQSTQNQEKVFKILNSMKPCTTDLKFFNTVCRPTRMKQQEMKIMPLENDLMIIIGSKTSANTKRLYEISKSLNTRSYWIQSKAEIMKKWFKNAKNLGITAGASTPDSTTQDIIKHIKQITR